MTYNAAPVRVNSFANSLWLLFALFGWGLLTWVGFLVIAIRRPNHVAYWVSSFIWFFVGVGSIIGAVGIDSPSSAIASLFFAWIAGCIHSFIANVSFIRWLKERANGFGDAGAAQQPTAYAPNTWTPPTAWTAPTQPATVPVAPAVSAPVAPVVAAPAPAPAPAAAPPAQAAPAPTTAEPASTGDAVIDAFSGSTLAAGYYQNSGPATAPATAATFPLDANTASREHLALIPGIDQATIERILAAREARPFVDSRDLVAATELAPHLFARLAPNLTVVSAPTRSEPTLGGTAKPRRVRKLDI